MSELASFDLLPITVCVPIEDENERKTEVRFPGFLTSAGYAMYVEPRYGDLCFAGVEETTEATVYRLTTPFTTLGRITDQDEDEQIIGQLTQLLHQMTAYDFLAKVIINVPAEIEFRETIIPNLLKKGGLKK